MKVFDIIWDTDGEDIDDLPTEVEILEDIDEDEVADYLSDEYGWCVESFSLDSDGDEEEKPSTREEPYTAAALLFSTIYMDSTEQQGFFEIDEDEDIRMAVCAKFGDALLADDEEPNIIGNLKKNTLYLYIYDVDMANGTSNDMLPNVAVSFNASELPVKLYEIEGFHSSDLLRTSKS